MNDIDVGKRIRLHRKRIALTQQELADRIGVTWEMISRYERGRSSALQKILALAKEFAVEPSALLYESTSAKVTSSLLPEFYPVIHHLPNNHAALRDAVQETGDGKRLYISPEINAIPKKFALTLTTQSKVRIEVSSISLRGMLLCTTEIDTPANEDIFVVSQNGTYVVTDSPSLGATLVARVLQWVVTF
jgi:transcriptional regulator with XRE-family HTH domain